MLSGVGKTLKVCVWGVHVRRKASGKLFVVVGVPPLHFLVSTISRFGERFRHGQYTLVSFLFAGLLPTVPHIQP